MKKLIAIFLVVLVGGFVFAAGEDLGGGDATLTIKADINQKTNHGFYIGDALDSFGDIFNSTSLGDGLVEELDMEISTSQPLGNYSFATTSASSFKINLTGTPLQFEGDDEIITYVPFEVLFTADAEALLSGGISDDDYKSVTFKFDGITLASATPSTDEEDYVSDIGVQLLFVNGTSQVRWATYELAITFNGGGNISAGIPEGTYVGTLSAEIIAN